MAKKRIKQAYKELGRFAALPFDVINSERYRALSHSAARLLIDLTLQLHSSNNGDISAAQSVLDCYGWRDSTRKRGLKELVKNELLVMTRQGGKHKCSLYAVSWRSIDYCNGKLDIQETNEPPINFKIERIKKNGRTLKVVQSMRTETENRKKAKEDKAPKMKSA